MEDNASNYKRLFKEILQNSLKTNCLCYYLNLNKKDTRDSYRNNLKNSGTFDNYGAYLDDGDEEGELKICETNTQLTRFTITSTNRCDTSCYEQMQSIYKQLANCIDSINELITKEEENDIQHEKSARV